MMRWYPLLRGGAYLSGLIGILLFLAARRQILTHPAWLTLGGLLILLMGIGFMASFMVLFLCRHTGTRRSRTERDR